jgi:hypothetical protein
MYEFEKKTLSIALRTARLRTEAQHTLVLDGVVMKKV